MLFKLYLVSVEAYRPSHPHKGGRRPRRRKHLEKLHQHNEWIKVRNKIREAALQGNARSLIL